jgi:hypothetical protein
VRDKMTTHLEELYAAEQKKLEAQDKKMIEAGYRCKITYWVHPLYGGDDYCVDAYFKEIPSKEYIEKKLLRNSAIKNDYKIVAIGL